MATALSPDARAAAARRAWKPREHGAWAMLLVPILLGIAISEPGPWQLVLGAAAVLGYLFSTTLQAWLRARRSPLYQPPLLTYGGAFAALAVSLVASFPALLLVGLVALPAALIVVSGARPGTKRDLANSLAQVAVALPLVAAAAWVSGAFDLPAVVAATAVAGSYLVGTVLTVRSVIRERNNRRFAVAAIGFHVVLVLLSAVLLPVAYTVVAAGLAARAAAFPILQGRLAGTAHPLRPIHLGVVEIVASLALVLVAFSVPLRGVLGG